MDTYSEDYVLSEFEIKMNSLIEEEVNNKIGLLKEDLAQKNKSINNLIKEKNILQEENNKLKNLHSQIETFEMFKGLVNEDNFGKFLCHFDLEKDSIDFNGMDGENIPNWFKWLLIYYKSKEKLFRLMDLFNIKYPSIAKQIKIPYDYNEKELDIIFKKLHKMYVCNGCIFNGNIGFWNRELRYNQYDFYKLFEKASYVEIPWQLFLRNPLLLSEKYFDEILDAIKTKKSHSNYFYRLPEYQELSEEQFNKMAELLPKDTLFDDHKRFIELDKNIIKRNKSISEKFKDKINDNRFSTFYYLNYPVEMQKEYIRNYNKSYYAKIDLIKKMNITKEEKIEFLQEFVKEEFE